MEKPGAGRDEATVREGSRTPLLLAALILLFLFGWWLLPDLGREAGATDGGTEVEEIEGIDPRRDGVRPGSPARHRPRQRSVHRPDAPSTAGGTVVLRVAAPAG